MAGNEITVDDRDLIIAALRGTATTRREAAADPASGALRSHYLATACAANALAEASWSAWVHLAGSPQDWLGLPSLMLTGCCCRRRASRSRSWAQVVINSTDAFGCFTATAAGGCYFEAGEEAYLDGPSLCIPVTMHVPSRWCPHFVVTVTPADLAEEGTDD
jgi:hypothetical protein